MSRLRACPRCSYPADTCGAFGEEPRAPRGGDFIICIGCLGINVFVLHPLLGVQLRSATTAEETRVMGDPLMKATIRILLAKSTGSMLREANRN